MVTNVTRATIATSVMQNFLDLMSDNLTPVILPNPSTGGNQTFTIQRYTTTDPDTMLKEKANYPLVTVAQPELPEIPVTFKNITVNGKITIGIHSTNSLAKTIFYDKMKEIIITNKAALAGAGLHEIIFTEDDADTNNREGWKDHWANFTVSFVFEYLDGY